MANLEIQQRAQGLLNQHSQGRVPVPVIEIAARLGIKVLSDPNYPENRSGHIQINEDGSTSIIVNAKQSATRKRFTIAHEIAHFEYDLDYLQTHRIIDRDGDAADPSYRAREKRANEFAAELIMPEEQFIQQWIALNSLEEIANYFGVSSEAATYRAINIGLTAAK